MDVTMPLPTLFGQLPLPVVSYEAILSVLSISLTAYFWMVKARRERPSLEFFQMRSFRANLRRGEEGSNTKRLGLTQIEQCGILIANNSTRQNSIVRFNCSFKYQGASIKGYWGYMEDEKFPWNIAPESAIDVRLACFFDVPEDFEIPDDMDFRVEFLTVGGRQFGHTFSLRVPEE
jgi:hypothetical protein